ncbi:MAG: hypothetical protein Fur0044_52260 [Anaerolineae bacterium]|nr:hypothetical protein [Anaerolineales bacterium]MCQ3977274.1 hypothetical protein [Anaerolineae bacterium]
MAIEITPKIEEALIHLGQYAQASERQQFVALAETVDWSACQPEELLRTIDLALSLELSSLAIKLAQQGRRLFPKHERIQQAARVLTPPVGREVSTAYTQNLSASQLWLREHAPEYRGRWVAVREGELVATGESLQELTTVIGEDEDLTNTLISKVL